MFRSAPAPRQTAHESRADTVTAQQGTHGAAAVPGPLIRPALAGITIMREPEKMKKAKETEFIPPLEEGFTRHHMVSKDALMALYNKAADSKHLHLLDPAMQAILLHHHQNMEEWKKSSIDPKFPGDELRMNDMNVGHVAETWAKMSAPPKAEDDSGAAEDAPEYGQPENRVAFSAMADMFQWTRGNLFEGPSNRGDDPKNGFDAGAQHIVEPERFKLASGLNDAIQEYVSGRRKGVKGKAGLLDESGLQTTLAKAAAHMATLTAAFPESAKSNPSHWELDGDGKPIIKRPPPPEEV